MFKNYCININMSVHNIILDLDQTLISAEPTDEFDVKKYEKKSKDFEFIDMDGYYIVYERPGLQQFLTYLFNNFNVSIWTAASKDYALFVIKNIILKDHPERKLDWILFSYHCDFSKREKSGSKDLQLLWDNFKLVGYNKTNTVIIDDYDEVQKTQPNNCINSPLFEFKKNGSEDDKFLHELQIKLDKLKAGETTIAKINEK